MAAAWQLVIGRPGGEEQVFPLEDGVYSIGQESNNHIVLNDPTISWRHAVLSVTPTEVAVDDLGSNTGTYLSGHRVTTRTVVPCGERIQLGGFVLRVETPDAAGGSFAASTQAAIPKTSLNPVLAQKKRELSPEQKIRLDIKRQVHAELLDRLDLRRMTAQNIGETGLQRRAAELVDQIMNDVRGRLPAGMDADVLGREVYNEAVKLGPLEDFLADESITEIMVNGHDKIYIERDGNLIRTEITFVDDASVGAIIERIVSPIGRRIDESQPYVDARLQDGSRVNAIIPPLSLDGPSITIRKFAKTPFTVDKLIEMGAMSRGMAKFIDICVKVRKNIIVSGGTGTGKTTFLNVVSGYLPDTDRIVTVEDAAELRLPQDHVIRLESRPANIEGSGAITIRDLVRNALRMRPDRIVVGECRGGEALDMLQAMNTGHEGSLTTVHANTPRDVVSRLETMVLMSGMELPVRAIREQIGAAIHMIIHLGRYQDGSRRVSKVTEICGMEGDKIVMQDLFEFKQDGLTPEGKVKGRMVPTGNVPTFLEEVRSRGLQLDPAVFDPAQEANV